jgi:hypothetical protein
MRRSANLRDTSSGKDRPAAPWSLSVRNHEGMGSRLLAVLTVMFVASSTASASVARGGLAGTVTRGPITPVCRVGIPCDALAPNLTLTFTHAAVNVTTRTDQRGRYRIELPVGTYVVRTSSKPFGRTPQPGTVRVRAGTIERIDFTIDTGIR